MERHRFKNIPTHLIAGPLGAGKTTVLEVLLQQRPEHETWALLINEFGQVGLDAALLHTADKTVVMAEIAGGCICCINGLPFRVGLNRLLRHSRPDRLWIEASGLGHPKALLQQLAADPWSDVLALQPLTLVLDAGAMAANEPVPETQLAALPFAGLLIMNKSKGLSAQQRKDIIARLPDCPLFWTDYGQIPLSAWPQQQVSGQVSTSDNANIEPASVLRPLPILWRNTQDYHSQQQEQDGVFSLSWQCHPASKFSASAVLAWLQSFSWLRAKAVLHTDQGWQALNALPGQPLCWQATDPRQDQRLELISQQRMNIETMTADLLAMRINR